MEEGTLRAIWNQRQSGQQSVWLFEADVQLGQNQWNTIERCIALFPKCTQLYNMASMGQTNCVCEWKTCSMSTVTDSDEAQTSALRITGRPLLPIV